MNNDAPDAPLSPSRSRGLLLVMTGASGVGKGTLRERWLQGSDVFYSVSWTTREQRSGEVQGHDYHFVSRETFEAERSGGGFYESAEFVGNWYGTPVGPVEAALSRGQDVVLEIEVQGAMQVARRSPEAILIFIVPPSLEELERRLRERGSESPERVTARLARARQEMLQAPRFRYLVVNDAVDTAVEDLRAIRRAEGLRSHRRYAGALASVGEAPPSGGVAAGPQDARGEALRQD